MVIMALKLSVFFKGKGIKATKRFLVLVVSWAALLSVGFVGLLLTIIS
jgi:nitrate reductase NapE component